MGKKIRNGIDISYWYQESWCPDRTRICKECDEDITWKTFCTVCLYENDKIIYHFGMYCEKCAEKLKAMLEKAIISIAPKIQ